MSHRKTIEQVARLLDRKEKLERNINFIKSNNFKNFEHIEMTTTSRNSFVMVNSYDSWLNHERFWGKLKYLILAELEETLSEINAGIDSKVTFKEEVTNGK